MIQQESESRLFLTLTYRPNESWNHAFYLLNCSLSPPPPTHYKGLLLINITHKRAGSGGHRRAFMKLIRWYLKASTVGEHLGDSIFGHVMTQNHEGKIKIRLVSVQQILSRQSGKCKPEYCTSAKVWISVHQHLYILCSMKQKTKNRNINHTVRRVSKPGNLSVWT